MSWGNGASWIVAMTVSGACSAGAIVLIRESPHFTRGLSPMVVVGLYLLLGGIGTLSLGLAINGSDAIVWPGVAGFGIISAIGVLLAVLEIFFVLGARWHMPLPDAMIVYNFVSLAILAVVGIIFYREGMNAVRIVGLLSGVISLLCLLRGTK